jgi:hypothetical protein
VSSAESDAESVVFDDLSEYTEVTHTIYATVAGAPPFKIGARHFTPERITARYTWRSAIPEGGWSLAGIEISGPWAASESDPTPTGSGMALLWSDITPPITCPRAGSCDEHHNDRRPW